MDIQSAEEKPQIHRDTEHTPMVDDDIWTIRPGVLSEKWDELLPNRSYTANRNSNALARFILASSMVRFGLRNDFASIWQGATAVMLSSLYRFPQFGKAKVVVNERNIETAEQNKNMDHKRVYVGDVGDTPDDDVDISTEDYNRMTMKGSEAPARQMIRSANETRIFATRPPPQFEHNDLVNDQNTVGTAKYVSLDY
jgi:hypothetical protein